MMEPPRPCTKGKGTMSIIPLALHLICPPREHEHTGPLVRHTGFDRGMNDATSRVLEQYFLLKQVKTRTEKEDPLLEFLLTWNINTPCSLHDFDNAGRLPLYYLNKNENLLKEIYIALQSCRHSYKQLADARGEWIATNLRRRPVPDTMDVEATRELWCVIGAPEEAIDEIMSMGFVIEDGDPCVSEDIPIDKLHSRMQDLLLRLWQFKTVSWGRWIGSGAPCRQLIGANLAGLPSVVAQVIDDGSESNYYINGFTKLSEDAKLF